VLPLLGLEVLAHATREPITGKRGSGEIEESADARIEVIDAIGGDSVDARIGDKEFSFPTSPLPCDPFSISKRARMQLQTGW
jgi:hypothetical protein